MMVRVASGANHSIDVDGPLVTCRVWSRPDLDVARGAQLATELGSHLRNLARGTAAALLFDLSAAPAVVGPKTQGSLEEMLRLWHDAGKPVALVISSRSIQRLQMGRLIAPLTPGRVAHFTTADEALAWLRTLVPQLAPPPA